MALALVLGLLVEPGLVAARAMLLESSRTVSLTAAGDPIRDLSRPSGEGRQLVAACEHAARWENGDARLPARAGAHTSKLHVRSGTTCMWFPPPQRRRPPPRGSDRDSDPSS